MITFNGGLIGQTRTTSTNKSVPGVWTLRQQLEAVRNSIWPLQAGWTPAEISSEIWLDAADSTTITIIDDLISQWGDKSGNNRNVSQAFSSLRPQIGSENLNGLNVISFLGSGQRLAASTNSDWIFLHDSTSSSVFCVIKYGNSENPAAVYSSIATDANSINNVGFRFGFDDRSTFNSPTNNNALNIAVLAGGTNCASTFSGSNMYPGFSNIITPNEHNIICAITSPAAPTASDRIKASINGGSLVGSQARTGTPSTASPTWPLTIGASGSGTTSLLGEIAEIIILSSTVSTDNRQKIEGYLAHKWGLLEKLPNDHPYKTSPP
jgi:hypothetical protein